MTSVPRTCRRRYFSLMEIMIAMVIIGLITSIVGMNLYKNIDKAKANKARAEISNLKDCVGMFYTDMGDFPRSL